MAEETFPPIPIAQYAFHQVAPIALGVPDSIIYILPAHPEPHAHPRSPLAACPLPPVCRSGLRYQPTTHDRRLPQRSRNDPIARNHSLTTHYSHLRAKPSCHLSSACEALFITILNYFFPPLRIVSVTTFATKQSSGDTAVSPAKKPACNANKFEKMHSDSRFVPLV
jgi:hypothetical protein